MPWKYNPKSTNFEPCLFFLQAHLGETPDSPETSVKTFRINVNYSGVDRCGRENENKSEAANAAKKTIEKAQNSDSENIYELKEFIISDISTSKWKETDRFGFPAGRKCKTNLQVEITAIVTSK